MIDNKNSLHPTTILPRVGTHFHRLFPTNAQGQWFLPAMDDPLNPKTGKNGFASASTTSTMPRTRITPATPGCTPSSRLRRSGSSISAGRACRWRLPSSCAPSRCNEPRKVRGEALGPRFRLLSRLRENRVLCKLPGKLPPRHGGPTPQVPARLSDRGTSFANWGAPNQEDLIPF